MAQTNTIVTYAPGRPTAATERDSVGDRRNRKRWGSALAGALLAGGAVFALGTFVRPDGTVRQTGVSLPSSGPLAKADRATGPEFAPPLREATRPEPQSSPLPYLALVRDIAPEPAPTVAARQPLSAPAARDAARLPRRTVMRAAVQAAPIREDSLEETVTLAPPSAAAPVTGQRRDLEGFLGEQGLVLAVPAQPSEGVAPVADWAPDEVAAAGGEALSSAPVPTAAPTHALAVTEAVAPAPSDTSVIAALEAPQAGPAVAVPTLVEMPATTVPETAVAAGSTRLVRIQPIEIEPLAAAPAEVATAANRGEPEDTAARLAIASIPLSPGAGVAEAPAATYAQSYPMAVVNGEALGAITLRDLGAQGQALHLGTLVGLLKLRMPEAEFVRLSSADAADRFVTLDQLRAAGITVQFDARDGRLLIDAR